MKLDSLWQLGRAARTGMGLAIGVCLLSSCSPAPQDSADKNAEQTSNDGLFVYCAAGLKPAVEAAARAFRKETGTEVQIQYGGSGTLLGNLRVANRGDLFIAADQSHIDAAREFGVIDEVIPLATQRAVIVVPKGNPKGISSLSDLWTKDLSIQIANPEAAAIGATVRDTLTELGQWERLKERIKVFKPTVNDGANDVRIGAVDASIVWDSVAAQYPDLDVVPMAEFENRPDTVSVAVLRSTKNPAAALKFARFLAAPDRGGKEFAAQHFTTIPGDKWAARPELNLFSGSMLRPGLEETLKEFERREGCRITTVYNGCGILVAQMRVGERPDAYFSCDTTFMDKVADLYATPVNVVDNQVVIIVPRGNPKGIQGLEDLTAPGLRLGLPHRERSAMGSIILQILQDTGVYGRLGSNLKVESPTGDFLVNQLRTGSLDAIVACRSNQVESAEYLEYVPVEHRLAKMVQPYAVGKESAYPQLASRLMDFLVTDESRQRFEQAGFGWRHGK